MDAYLLTRHFSCLVQMVFSWLVILKFVKGKVHGVLERRMLIFQKRDQRDMVVVVGLKCFTNIFRWPYAGVQLDLLTQFRLWSGRVSCRR